MNVGDTPEVQELFRVSQLLPNDKCVVMLVTATRWARIAAELAAGDLEDPLRLPTPDNFKEMRVGKNLLVVNSGMEDEYEVHRRNIAAAEQTNFQARRQRLRTG